MVGLGKGMKDMIIKEGKGWGCDSLGRKKGENLITVIDDG